MDKSGSLFTNWLKNFTVIVFNQTFHAVFLMFIMRFLSAFMDKNGGQTLEQFVNYEGIFGVVAIAGMMGLIKLEKLVKDLFGIKDSKLMGGIGDNLAKSMLAIRSGIDLAKRTKEPFDKYNEAKKNTTAKRRALDDIKKRNAFIDSLGSNESNGATASATANNNINASNVNAQLGNAQINNQGAGQGAGQGGGGLTNEEALNRLIIALENNANAMQNNSKNKDAMDAYDRKQAENEAQAELDKAERDENMLRRQRVGRLATTVAAAGMGFGATDNVGDAVTFANLVDRPMDFVADKTAQKAANVDQARKIDARRMNSLNLAERAKNDKLKTSNPQFKAEYAKLEKKYAERAREEAKQVNEFLDEIPKTSIKSYAKTWAGMVKDSSPVRVSKRDASRSMSRNNVRLSVDSSLTSQRKVNRMRNNLNNGARSIDDI